MKETQFPKISFGIIVLNGEPFTRYCLRSLYPFAYEIIVVEGASKNAKAISTDDGHSTDGTLEVLYGFKKEEDIEDKVKIITKEGFWSEKDEQSQAYARHATGDYLWQVDIDEFYKPDDMAFILQMLKEDPSITAISFKQITFWGSPNYVTDSWYLRGGANYYHRLFKWGAGYKYVSHRPPTVVDKEGKDLRSIKWVRGEVLARKGIYLYHYSLLFPKQVFEKVTYYSSTNLGPQCERMVEWAKENYMQLKRPFRVHNVHTHPSWLEHFSGTQPQEAINMFNDAVAGQIKVELRSMLDVENLLRSFWYRFGRATLKALFGFHALGNGLQTLKQKGKRFIYLLYKRLQLFIYTKLKPG